MNRLHAGLLSHRIIVEQQLSAADALGGQRINWELHRIIWAYIKILRTITDTKTESLITRPRYEVICREDDSILVNMRMLIRGVPHLIDSVTLHEQQGFMICRVSGDYI